MADGRYIFRECVPDGAIDIANVAPGDVLNRAWSFRVNEPPGLQDELDSGVFDPGMYCVAMTGNFMMVTVTF